MVCYLIPTLIGIGSAIIGGIISWLMYKQQEEKSISRYHDLYTNYHLEKQNYEELEKYHQLAIGEVNKLTEKQEILINSYRQNKEEIESLNIQYNNQIANNSACQTLLAEYEQTNLSLKSSITKHLADSEQLVKKHNTEISLLNNELASKPKEVIKEIEVVKEVPVEVIREVDRLVEIPVEVIREVPVEIIKEVERIVEIPFEVIREIEVIREVPVEVIKEVERIVEIPVEVIREIEVIREVPVEVIKEVERIVEIPFEVIREIEVIREVPVEIIKEVERIVEIPFEVIREIEVIREVPVEVIKEVERLVEIPFEVIREIEVIREVPTTKIKGKTELANQAIKKKEKAGPKVQKTTSVKPVAKDKKITSSKPNKQISKTSTTKTNTTKIKPGRRRVEIQKPIAKIIQRKEDLLIIEGIGPVIAKLLNKANIYNFEQLSKTSKREIQKILDNAGPRFRIHDPSSWPEQAKLLFKGKLTEFKALTNRLKGGRK